MKQKYKNINELTELLKLEIKKLEMRIHALETEPKSFEEELLLKYMPPQRYLWVKVAELRLAPFQERLRIGSFKKRKKICC